MEVRTVITPQELQKVYRLRYAIYEEEMEQNESYADHLQKTIIDPLDHKHAAVFAAWSCNRIVGTVRVNLVRHGGVGDYLRYYRIEPSSPADCDAMSITTRGMVLAEYRGSTAMAQLSIACYQFALDRGIATDFIDCAFQNEPFFRRLGYIPHRRDFDHPEYGPGIVMKLNLRDSDHLQACRSPFLKRFKSVHGARWQKFGDGCV